jgi:hypothetical protein
MVSLVTERPQVGEGGFTNLAHVARHFESLYAEHCDRLVVGRDTPEKRLQSFFIRDAQTHGRKMAAINSACADGTELEFVTDEIAMPLSGTEMKCDVLALRRDGGRSTPVLLELKSERDLTELVRQVTGYAALIDAHADLFAELYGALLGERVVFDGPTEKWIVWPPPPSGRSRRNPELAANAIRVVVYREEAGSYEFNVGSRVPTSRAAART